MAYLYNLIKPIVLNWLVSRAARKLLVEVLGKLARKSDNKVDDALVAALARALYVDL